ncbi:MAG TPA: L,D-transpeptidase family protein [Steroidobacteraceae bacterium]|nr:L,D-transpeptidase family protein [Steroidobacteraceae bacterium]
MVETSIHSIGRFRVQALFLAAMLGAALVSGGARADSAVAQVVNQPMPLTAMPTVTRVVVYKSARRMELLNGDQVLRSYRVSLGLQPRGHKEREGDFRTPEGRYYLTRRNPRSDFFLSIQVSYPNDRDVTRARSNGWEPGGAIMIHGMPNRLRQELDYYTRDWTDGCIAVSNSDMVEIWLFTNSDTPIDILP